MQTFGVIETTAMAWHEVEAPDGWRLELFEVARGRLHPPRWRGSSAFWITEPDPYVSEGLQGYAFCSPEEAVHHAYRERLQRYIVLRMNQLRSLGANVRR